MKHVGCQRIELPGQRFGMLTVLRVGERTSYGQWKWVCRCDCGAEKAVLSQHLREGKARSCGCGKGAAIAAARQTHGRSKTPEHNIWVGILSRCTNPNRKSFSHYGGRGVQVCERWRTFENFLADMGPRPSPAHSIDRYPDPAGNYEPDNCRWATDLEQANNKISTRFVEYRGKRLALCDAVRLAGSKIHYEAAWIRINTCGWPVDCALETPSTRNAADVKRERAERAAKTGVGWR